MFCLAIIRLILHLRVVAAHPYSSSREYSVLDLQHLQRGVLALSLVSDISFCEITFRSLLPFVHFLVNASTESIPRSEFLLSPKYSRQGRCLPESHNTPKSIQLSYHPSSGRGRD